MIDRGRTLLSNGSLVIGYFRFGTDTPTGSVFEGGLKDNKVDSVDDICKHIDFNSKLQGHKTYTKAICTAKMLRRSHFCTQWLPLVR